MIHINYEHINYINYTDGMFLVQLFCPDMCQFICSVLSHAKVGARPGWLYGKMILFYFMVLIIWKTMAYHC